jgi:hypothetical protein
MGFMVSVFWLLVVEVVPTVLCLRAIKVIFAEPSRQVNGKGVVRRREGMSWKRVFYCHGSAIAHRMVWSIDG